MNWIKEHPYMTGGVVLLLLVLFLVFRRRSGGGTQVIQTGPSDAVTAANLQSQVQLAGIQAAYAAHASDLSAAIAGKQLDARTALAVAGAQKDVALQSIVSSADVQNQQTREALQATQYSTQAVVQQQEIQGQTQTQIAGIQSDVLKSQIAAQLAAQGIVSKATVDVATIQGNTDRAQTEAALAAIQDTNKTTLAQTLDTNASNVTIAGKSADTATTLATLQAQSQDLVTRTAGNVYTDQIDTQGSIANNYITTQGAIAQNRNNIVQNLILSNQVNKGGEGGSNQVSLLDTWLGNFQGGTTAAGAAGAQGVAGANMWSNIIGTIGGAFTSLTKIF